MGGGSSKAVGKPTGQVGTREIGNLDVAATNLPRDWNDDFQRGLEMVEKEQYLEGYTLLANVIADFREKADYFNRIIISELALVSDEKTFLPRAFKSNDDANFTIYGVQNIEFRVANGGQGSKSWVELGNELRHSKNILHCRLHDKNTGLSHICVPLMMILDYKGFRTLAVAKITAQTKYVHGWDPVLKGFVMEDSDLQSLLVTVGTMLNLSYHKLGVGSTAVLSSMHAGIRCLVELQGINLLKRKKRIYFLDLKDLMPPDLTKGARWNLQSKTDGHVEMSERVRPEYVRRYEKPLSPDIGIPPPNRKAINRYIHEGIDHSLSDLKNALQHLTVVKSMELIDSLSRDIQDFRRGKDSLTGLATHDFRGQPLNYDEIDIHQRIMSNIHAAGFNRRMLGFLRSKVKEQSYDPAIFELRKMLLNEMVSRVLKTSIYKVLRIASGFYGQSGSMLQAIKAQFNVDKEQKITDEEDPHSLPEISSQITKANVLSTETSKAALVDFFDTAFSRQYVEKNHAELREELEAVGIEPTKIDEVLTLSAMIAELRRERMKRYPEAVKAAIESLKGELALIIKASVPGAKWMADKYSNFKTARAEKLAQKKEMEAIKAEITDKLINTPLDTDPFSIYWRQSMKSLLIRKFGKLCLSSSELRTDWSVIDNIDVAVVVRRVETLTGIRLSREGLKKISSIHEFPLTPSSVVRWNERDFDSIGPKTKGLGLLQSARGWQLLHKSRSLDKSEAKVQMLQSACDCFEEMLLHHPNDWISNFEFGSALYELAWTLPTSSRYSLLRAAYRRFRHSHVVCRAWLPSMLRLGDSIYAMTLMRQDTDVEEDYVKLCVEAGDILDRSQEYANRCGAWADQVLKAAQLSCGFRSERLFTLAGVTFNEWIALRADEEAVSLAWILENHEELGLVPADISALVSLVKQIGSNRKKSNWFMSSKQPEQAASPLEHLYFTNKSISDACILLVSRQASIGEIRHVDLSNLSNITSRSLSVLCEEHGAHFESLKLKADNKVPPSDILSVVELCVSEGIGSLTHLSLYGMSNMKDGEFAGLVSLLPNSLKSLSLQFCLTLEDKEVIELAKQKTDLLELNLRGCEKITDNSILALAHHCLFLEKLDFSYCTQVSDVGLREFAYRTRRFLKGTKGIPTGGLFDHTDPTLLLADLIIKNRKKKKKADDEEDLIFDTDIAASDDPEAVAAFELEQSRIRQIALYKAQQDQEELRKILRNAGLTLPQIKQFLAGGRDDFDEDEGIDLDSIAIKLGLEEPAQRERRLREKEKKDNEEKEKKVVEQCREMVKNGLRPFQIARELEIDISIANKVKEEWDLQNRKFVTLQEIRQEDLSKYAIHLKIPYCKVKRVLLRDVNPQSRLFLRSQLSSGGTVKNSAYKAIMTELNFDLDTSFPKIMDKFDVMKIELCERPDIGPAKALAYYKAPMPQKIDYPIITKKVPLYGSSGFVQGQPVGYMQLAIRAMSGEEHNAWRESLEVYEQNRVRTTVTSKMGRSILDRTKIVSEKVFERVVEYAVTQMLDYFQDYKKMHTLTISRCVKVTDFSVIEIVRSMPNIVCLNLEGLRGLTDNALRHIARLCPNLKKLELEACVRITDGGMMEVASGCHLIESVTLNECSELTDASIAFLVNFDLDFRLREISYTGLVKTTEESFGQICGSCSSLESLQVAGSKLYQDVQLVHLSHTCIQLRKLDLSWCESITDYGISCVARSCTKLDDVSLAYCDKITNQGFSELAHHCGGITDLDLTGCFGLDDLAMSEISRSLFFLSHLNISNCENVTKDSLVHIRDWAEGLTQLELLGCSAIDRVDMLRFGEKMRGRTKVCWEQSEDDFIFT